MRFFELLPPMSQIIPFLSSNRKRSLPRAVPADEDVSATPIQDAASHTWLQGLLRARAEAVPCKHLLFYPPGGVKSSPKQVSYRELYDEATRMSLRIAALPKFRPGSPVLLHLEDHWDTILWTWAVILAGGIPALSPALSMVEEHRVKHLETLSRLLESPVTILREASLPLFMESNQSFESHTVESLSQDCAPVALSSPSTTRPAVNHRRKRVRVPRKRPVGDDSLALLMLTSGSSGNAKAVRLSHRQLLAAVSGKAAVRNLPPQTSFLNWIGLDHVASLVEIHLQAMWLGLDQVHVHAVDIMASPSLFLDLLSRHRVSRSFAPNFFLAKLATACEGLSDSSPPWDLSNLTILASGGEANDVQTCAAAASLLHKHGAPSEVIMPGFGMTETCAGAIFNLECPRSDVEAGRAFASLGRCMPGIEMRIVDKTTGRAAKPNDPGHLEIRGDVVFEGYYRNPVATAEAFTSDGWFRTGDEGVIDCHGNLSLIGRLKDVININGVKLPTADVQAAVETALKNTAALRVVSFPSRAPEAATEQVTIAYVPKQWPVQPADVLEVDRLVTQACSMVTTACRPVVFGVGPDTLGLLPVTTLGKISGAKMRALFEAGVFDKDVVRHRETVDDFRRQRRAALADDTLSETEMLLRADVAEIMGISDAEEVAVETPIFELGFASMDVIRLKYRLDTRLKTSVATIVLMKHPTVRSLARFLDSLETTALDNDPVDVSAASENTRQDSDGAERSVVTETEYDPVVVLRSSGTKTPLWLVHPGVGEVLVFVGLAQHMRSDDRPIYALRARGFEPGQSRFADIDEAVETYTAAVRRKQPHGPFAIAGYSYGTMLAFEMAKRLGETGHVVSFLGSLNLPPHIKMRMRQLSWNMCLLHLAQFLGLVSEAYANDIDSAPSASPYSRTSRDEALSWVLQVADSSRLRDLGLGALELGRWADVAHGLQSMATDYEPSGLVPSIDVFHAEPLKAAASSREEWVGKQLSRWEDFSRSKPRFHRVDGAHYTMIGPEHVESFAKTLRAALYSRGA